MIGAGERMNMEKNKLSKIDLVIIIMIAVGLFFAIAQPHFEAKAYNKLTGGNATYWDALFTELRIVGSEK